MQVLPMPWPSLFVINRYASMFVTANSQAHSFQPEGKAFGFIGDVIRARFHPAK